MDQRTAWARLLELAPRNMLKLTTANGQDHIVVKLEAHRFRENKGILMVRAFTNEGDTCDGTPLAVLKRCTAHQSRKTGGGLWTPPGSVTIQAALATAQGAGQSV